ncbi:serine hydrolase domain-containing protein [Streptomyces sp. NPDC006739]|uniref:serine hydrolase domain-containing protein n=1 Tax=Streptomyces sp. NPDC006739 TaxID=3364763 RepID=UPI003694D030
MKLRIRAAAGLLAAGALLALTTAAPATAATRTRTGHLDSHSGVQDVLNRAVTEGGLPGATAQIVDGRDGNWFGRAGVADLGTGAQQQPQNRFRIGGTSQTFVATVMLQLVAEHKVSLDDSVERWLPGLVDGNGYDGSKITVRQLLNQTSGIYNYVLSSTILGDVIGTAFLEHRFDSLTPEQLVGLAVAYPPAFAPGTSWGSSETNYVLAGLIIEKATGRSLADEIHDRIARPLHLTGTYEPAAGDTGIDGPHGRAYSHLNQSGSDIPSYDVTELNPGLVFATGDMISTTGDLDTFFGALLRGRLLPPAEQQEMFTMSQTTNWIPGMNYGYGIASTTLSCGTTVYGMFGGTEGSWTYTYGTRDGRHLLSTNVNGDWLYGTGWSMQAPIGVFDAELKAEFCDK